MGDIKLPKTPLVPLFMDHDCRKELDAIIRARDLEVARVVLAAAAKVCGPYSHGQWFADNIKKLEIKHGK